ncbi:MAG: hypothetical protein AVDCRST_MAG67-2901 [uncultured Solirubrobacteraceae bacterium]|uniref:Uncharacterized protein n=1 Tax=uncultured Solirubrobacteraceae bacterium TaxID=1162706 RepID=A0A6J4T3G5_9ACTN|nr:MAG: hypothetical protein AVDCRST_MAG67-2901 [uncultured Solirubrobacteraceae bacterium]
MPATARVATIPAVRRRRAATTARCCFGPLTDRDLDPPPEVASEGLRAALAEHSENKLDRP